MKEEMISHYGFPNKREFHIFMGIALLLLVL
jgi:hypothetical protein